MANSSSRAQSAWWVLRLGAKGQRLTVLPDFDEKKTRYSSDSGCPFSCMENSGRCNALHAYRVLAGAGDTARERCRTDWPFHAPRQPRTPTEVPHVSICLDTTRTEAEPQCGTAARTPATAIVHRNGSRRQRSSLARFGCGIRRSDRMRNQQARSSYLCDPQTSHHFPYIPVRCCTFGDTGACVEKHVPCFILVALSYSRLEDSLLYKLDR